MVLWPQAPFPSFFLVHTQLCHKNPKFLVLKPSASDSVQRWGHNSEGVGAAGTRQTRTPVTASGTGHRPPGAAGAAAPGTDAAGGAQPRPTAQPEAVKRRRNRWRLGGPDCLAWPGLEGLALPHHRPPSAGLTTASLVECGSFFDFQHPPLQSAKLQVSARCSVVKKNRVK